MATAYAAVISILHVIGKIQHHHASHIQSVGENPFIDALHKRAVLLQDFLENCNGEHVLVSRIADAAHAAEDVLESHIVDRIHALKENKWTEFSSGIRSSRFNQSLEKVIQDMDVIMEELKVEESNRDLHQLSINTTSVRLPSTPSTPPPPSVGMVGFEEYLKQLLEKLTGQERDLKVVPIVGMGGIGKTTLAKNVHAHPLIVQHFDLRACVAISRQYSVQKILSDLLFEISGIRDEDYNKLGERLHKELWGRRYLIVLDDMWIEEAWDRLKVYFPENNNGSRIIITTRISTIASNFGSCGMKLNLLDDDKSWNLLCEKVFGGEGNLPDDEELEKLGMMIAEKCKGLPLSIVTIGGLLAKSHKTTEYWESVLGNLNAILSEDDDEHCFKILSLSYNHLPIHLKPCFLYMGILPEDNDIPAVSLVQLWVAEGFLKPNKAKCLEEVANDYLKDLADRNLIILSENWGPLGKENSCSIHDLLRDLCLREAQKDKFLFLVNKRTNPNIESQRRIAIQMGMEDRITEDYAFIHDLESATQVQSFTTNRNKVHLPPTYRLLRVLSATDTCLGCEVFEHVNLRYLRFQVWPKSLLQFPSSINLFWNLETIIIFGAPIDEPIITPIEIWEMPHLRILGLYYYSILPHPPSGQSNNHENGLQQITRVMNFKLTEDVIQRILNVKTLANECDPEYDGIRGSSEDDDDCCVVENLHRLIKLESLYLKLDKCPHSLGGNWQQQINFPNSLKELTLFGCRLPWESICMTKIGLLPYLEELTLWDEAFIGDEWNTFYETEQIFPSLKFLKIESCRLKYWNADDSSFPRLECLVLEEVDGLDEMPLDIGKIPTLQSIHLKQCSQALVDSANQILREQKLSFGNDSFRVYISESEDGSDDGSQEDNDDESQNESEDHASTR